MNLYILVHTKYIPVCTWYVPLHTEYVPSTSYNWWCFPQVDCSWAEKGHCYAAESWIRLNQHSSWSSSGNGQNFNLREGAADASTCRRDIDPDLHQGIAKGSITCFNLLEGAADGDQDLNLLIREVEDVCLEFMEDPLFKGNQDFHFEMDLDELGERMFGCEANAGVSFQIGQLRCVMIHDEYIPVHTQYIPDTYWIWTCFSCCRAGDRTVPLAIVVDIDGSFVKHKIPVKPIYVKGDGAWNEVWVGFVWICTCTNKVHTFHPKYVSSTY